MEKQLPPSKLLSLGLQHVLAMYAGAVLVPIIVGSAVGISGANLAYLISIDLAACGIATLLQAWKNRFFGIGLPVMMGCSFTAVNPMIIVGKEYGIGGICGSILAAGVIIVLLSFIMGKVIQLFTPVVVGTVVTLIGVTLIPVAINNMGGGQGAADFGSTKNLLLSFGVLLLIIVMYRLFKGFMRTISILLGIIIGTIAAYPLGMVDLAPVKSAGWIQMLKPFSFGTPTFHIDAIISMTIVLIVCCIESTGVYFALSEICNKPIDKKSLEKGYRAEGLSIVLGGLFNAFPYTTFSQNVGLVQLTKVKNVSVIITSGLILVILGFIPKISTLTTVIPNAVIGGASLALFGMVISTGIRMLSKVDFLKQENLLIIACSIGLGLGVTVQPALFAKLPTSIQIITNNGIVLGSLTALLLSFVFSFKKQPAVSTDANDVVTQPAQS